MEKGTGETEERKEWRQHPWGEREGKPPKCLGKGNLIAKA